MQQATAQITAALPEKERRRRLADLSGEPTAGHFVPYRGRYVKVPVVTVGSDMLLYRAENGRLIARLNEKACSLRKTLAEVYSDQDTAEVQQLLHGLLVAEAADPRGPIFAELERLELQTEPLLVTAAGVVVNGNRRLAAMRELLHRAPDRYAGFAEVAVAILPADALPADLEFIEATLQMAPETKLAYGWIGRRLKMRRQRDELGLPLETMRDSYRLEDAAAIDREIRELALAEDYLSNYRGAAGQYSLVEDAEALFVGLCERLALLPGSLRPLWRLAGFAMIDGRASVHGPMDRQFPFAAPVPDHLPASALRGFAEDHDLAVSESSELSPQIQDDLAAILADRGRSSELAPELYRVMERVRGEFQSERLPKRVIKQLRKVRESLSRLEPEKFSGREGRQLRSELAAIQAQAAYLLGERGEPPVKLAAASTIRRLLGRG